MVFNKQIAFDLINNFNSEITYGKPVGIGLRFQENTTYVLDRKYLFSLNSLTLWLMFLLAMLKFQIALF